jgi:hypothetical protein
MSMPVDAQDEPVPELLPIGGDVRTTDVVDEDDDDESEMSEMGLEDREGLDDLESDSLSDGNSYDQDSDDYDD